MQALGEALHLVVCAWSRDGRTVIAAGKDGHIYMWGQERQLAGSASGLEEGAALPCAAAGGSASTNQQPMLLSQQLGAGPVLTTAVEPDNWRPQGRLCGHTGCINALLFSKDGRQLVSAGADGSVRVSGHCPAAINMCIARGKAVFWLESLQRAAAGCTTPVKGMHKQEQYSTKHTTVHQCMLLPYDG